MEDATFIRGGPSVGRGQTEGSIPGKEGEYVVAYRAGMTMWILMVLALPMPASSEMPEADESAIQRWGIHYPGGYDINTVRVIEGVLVETDIPEHGPVTLKLQDDRRSYTVLAGPHWFWRREDPPWRTGDRLRVTGALVQGRDGGLYIMAAEISSKRGDGREVTLRLRNPRGEPLWMGRHGMMRGPRRGMMP